MPSSAPTGRDSEKFNLRLPDGMRDRIAEAAKRNGRSMNSEIVSRLEESFSKPLTEAGATEVMDRITKMILDDPISMALAYDDEAIASLERFALERSILPADALLVAFRDWAIGHGYLELPPDREDAN